MNNAKDRKRWITYANKKSQTDPLHAIQLLTKIYHAQPQRNRAARVEMLRHIRALRLQYANSIWEKQRLQTGQDIPALTQTNLALWQQRAAEHYSAVTITMLRKAWYHHVVPQFKLNHVTRDLISIRDTGALKSINVRQQKATVNNSNTGGTVDVRRGYVYFTLALQAMSPDYWRDKPELIQVDCQQAQSDSTAPLLGLWIGSHFVATTLSSQYFDDCLRTVSYDNNQRRTRYVYPDGQTKEVNISCDEEIFCAQQGLNDIFDGLFFQIIVDIAHIGGAFRARLLNPASTAEVLAGFYQYAFSPSTYPEAKLCGQLDLHADYVKTYDHYGPAAKDIIAFYQAIKQGSVQDMQTLLAREPDLIKSTTQSDTACSAVLRSNNNLIAATSTCLAMLDILIAHGFDPSYEGGTANNIFSTALSAGKHYHAFCHSLIDGIPVPSQPYIRLAINFYSFPLAIRLAIEGHHIDILQKLLAKGVTPSTDNRFLYDLFHHNIQLPYQDRIMTKEETILWVIKKYHVDIHDKPGSIPLLHHAAQYDLAFLQWWLPTFPQYDINVTNSERETALHYAIARGANDANISALLKAGIDTQRVNHKGQTALSFANELAQADARTLRYYSTLGGRDNYEEMQSTAEEFTRYLRQRYQNYVALLQPTQPTPSATLPAPANPSSASLSTTPIVPKTALKQRKTAAAMVIATTEQDGPMVLFVRKKDAAGSAIGPYIFPGGFCDATDATPNTAAERECKEEAGLQITATRWLSMEFTTDKMVHQHTFSLCTFTALPKQPLNAADDVAIACWIPWNKVIQKSNGYAQHCYFDHLLIEPSNADAVRLALLRSQDKQSCEQIWRNKLIAEETLLVHYKNNDLAKFIRVVKQDLGILTEVYWLHNVIMHARENWLSPLLECGIPLNQSLIFETGITITPLIAAISKGAYAMARSLLTAGANVNLATNEASPLAASVLRPRDDNAKVFLDDLLTLHRVDLSQEIGLKALSLAIEVGNSWAFEKILAADGKKVIDLNRSFTHGWSSTSLLALACASANLAIVRLLMSHGAQPIVDQDSRVFQKLFWEAGQPFFTLNHQPHFQGCDQPVNPDLFMQKLTLLRNYDTQQLTVARYLKLLKVWEALTDNAFHYDYGITGIRLEASKVFQIYRRIVDGETYILFMQNTITDGSLPSQFKQPFTLPSIHQEAVNRSMKTREVALFDLLNGLTFQTSQVKPLTTLFLIVGANTYQENRFIVIDTTEESPTKLNLYSSYEYEWIKWSEVVKTTADPMKSYYQYRGRSITQADACLCEYVHTGLSFANRQDEMQQLLYEKLLATMYLTEAYNKNDTAQLTHLINAGVVNLNERYDCEQSGYYITLPEFDRRYNRGALQNSFAPMRHAAAASSTDDDNNTSAAAANLSK